ncbi:MAG: riboflavin synthase [Gammaproteobacteria bacterium]
MFTGIVAATGHIENITAVETGARFVIHTGTLDMSNVKAGDSIAVNGACLTVVELLANGFATDLSSETLELTNLGAATPADRVNLERALALGEELGGHLVTGHVDGVGAVLAVEPDGESVELCIEAPEDLARYIARKGSVCVDGTSLTVNDVDGCKFRMMIIPHTQTNTIIAEYAAGTRVNIEIDVIARYLERLVQYTGAS